MRNPLRSGTLRGERAGPGELAGPSPSDDDDDEEEEEAALAAAAAAADDDDKGGEAEEGEPGARLPASPSDGRRGDSKGEEEAEADVPGGLLTSPPAGCRRGDSTGVEEAVEAEVATGERGAGAGAGAVAGFGAEAEADAGMASASGEDGARASMARKAEEEAAATTEARDEKDAAPAAAGALALASRGDGASSRSGAIVSASCTSCRGSWEVLPSPGCVSPWSALFRPLVRDPVEPVSRGVCWLAPVELLADEKEILPLTSLGLAGAPKAPAGCAPRRATELADGRFGLGAGPAARGGPYAALRSCSYVDMFSQQSRSGAAGSAWVLLCACWGWLSWSQPAVNARCSSSSSSRDEASGRDRGPAAD